MKHITINKQPSYPFFILPPTFNDQEVELALKRECSYYLDGFEFTPAAREKGWDGRIELFKYDYRLHCFKFPAGLKERVVDILEINNYQVNVITSKPDTPDVGYIHWYGPELRSYQNKAVDMAKRRFDNGSGIVWHMGTGSGKTFSALKLAADMHTTTLILVHTRTLLKQWEDEVKKQLRIVPSIYHGKNKKAGPITISTYQTVNKDKKFDFSKFGLLILDECHHTPSDTFYDVVMRSPTPYKVGLTATPKREKGDEIKIEAATGKICTVVEPRELIDAGILAHPKFIFLRPRQNAVLGRTWQEEYDANIVKNRSRNQLIADTANMLLDRNTQVYVHVQQIGHGNILEGMIGGSVFLHGSDGKKKRDKTIAKFKNGEIRCLISTLLGEGSDFPDIECLIMASGHKSSVSTIQRAGRVLRKGKTGRALIVDFTDQGKYSSQWWQERLNCYIETYGSDLVFPGS